MDNPDKIPFKGQPYLPPTPNKEVPTDTRFGGDDDDAPIWGNKETKNSKNTNKNNGNRVDGDDPEAPIWGSNVQGTVHLIETGKCLQ